MFTEGKHLDEFLGALVLGATASCRSFDDHHLPL